MALEKKTFISYQNLEAYDSLIKNYMKGHLPTLIMRVEESTETLVLNIQNAEKTVNENGDVTISFNI